MSSVIRQPSAVSCNCPPSAVSCNCQPTVFSCNCPPSVLSCNCQPSAVTCNCQPQAISSQCHPAAVSCQCQPAAVSSHGQPTSVRNHSLSAAFSCPYQDVLEPLVKTNNLSMSLDRKHNATDDRKPEAICCSGRSFPGRLSTRGTNKVKELCSGSDLVVKRRSGAQTAEILTRSCVSVGWEAEERSAENKKTAAWFLGPKAGWLVDS